jgi:hypothetical protein
LRVFYQAIAAKANGVAQEIVDVNARDDERFCQRSRATRE